MSARQEALASIRRLSQLERRIDAGKATRREHAEFSALITSDERWATSEAMCAWMSGATLAEVRAVGRGAS